MTLMMLTSGGKLPANDHRPGQFWLIRPPPVIGLAPCPTNTIKNTQNRVSKNHYIAPMCPIMSNISKLLHENSALSQTKNIKYSNNQRLWRNIFVR